MKSISLQNEKSIISNGITPINVESEKFNLIMNIYKETNRQLLIKLDNMKKTINGINDYEVISKVKGRVKSPESIINKMKKKNYNLNYSNLITKINDIAGIRVICTFKDDIYKVVDIIKQMPDLQVIEEKDYIKFPKKSGYSAYHIIVEVPIHILNNQIYVKAEIQFRTTSMDFWAMNEHKLKYKTNKELSFIDSKKLVFYSKALNILDNQMMRVYRKQECT